MRTSRRAAAPAPVRKQTRRPWRRSEARASWIRGELRLSCVRVTLVVGPSSRRVIARILSERRGSLPALRALPGLGLALALLGTSVHAAPAGPGPARASPAAFGRVFEENRARLVVVEQAAARSTGFVVGAEGEVLFAAPHAPSGALFARSARGRHALEILAHDPALGLAVGRLRALELGAVTPVSFAARSGLARERWVVVLKHRAQDRVEPFAGVVVRGPGKAPGATAAVEVPGAPGAPVFSPEGELVGVAMAEGSRRTRVLPVEALLPFLRAAVIGNEPDDDGT
jgi:hypothetical protein